MTKRDFVKIESAIEDVKQKISEYEGKPIYKSNEQATILQLINPILKSLGWDPEKPTDIHPEYNGIDICLKKNGENKIIIEAKSLVTRRNLGSKPLKQLGGYCAKEGIKYGIFTNGKRWEIYTWEKENTTLRKIWDLKLDEDDNKTLKFYFRKLLKKNIEELQEEVSFKRWMDDIWEEGMRNINEKIKENKNIDFRNIKSPWRAEIRRFLEERGDELRNLSIDYFDGEKYEPKTINIDLEEKYTGEMEINGKKRKLKKNPYEVLHETVRWLVENGHLTEDDLPIPRGKIKENNNATLISKDSKDIKRGKRVGDFYVHSSMNKGIYKDEAEWLLKHLKLDHIDLEVIKWPE